MLRLNRFTEAETFLKEAIALDEANVAEKSILVKRLMDYSTLAQFTSPAKMDTLANLKWAEVNLQDSYTELADCLLSQKTRIKEAESLIKKAMTIVNKEFVIPAYQYQSLISLSRCYRLQGRLKEAEQLSKRAAAIIGQDPGIGKSDRASSDYELASCYFEEGRLGEAEPLYKRALALMEEEHGWTDPTCDLVRQGLAQCYKSEGKSAEAELLLHARVGGKQYTSTSTSTSTKL